MKAMKTAAAGRFRGGILVLVLFWGVLLTACSSGQKSGERAVMGQPAPDFELHDQFGEVHRLSDYRGKVVFLNFWGTWCPPCLQEMPAIQALYEKHLEDEEVAVLGVAFPGIGSEGSEEEVTEFLYENGYSYPVLMNPAGELEQTYGIEAYPTTYTIDAEGRLSGSALGSLNLHMMEALIQQTQEGKTGE